MKLDELIDLYDLISRATQNISSRNSSMELRKAGLNSIISGGNGFTKMAFDTRRVDQETEYIPRRVLQNYQRSEAFVTEALFTKITGFNKLSKVLDQLKLDFGKDPEWQESYTRVLSSAVHKGLRTDQADGDFSDNQPSMASLDYLQELLYVRYRLTPENLLSMSDEKLREALLQKDELLLRKNSNMDYISPRTEISPSDVTKFSYEQMMEKMLSTIAQVISSYKPPSQEDTLTSKLFDIKATTNNPEVERTVTITIKDKVIDKLEKRAKEDLLESEIDSDKIDSLIVE